MFVDECVIEVVAGKGGDGCVSFRREKYVPRGGPDGGDGGDGGSVVLQVNPHLRTLYHLRHTPRFRAADGRPGQGKQMFGARGRGVHVEVPPGTTLVDQDSGELIADAVTAGAELVLAPGGRGGRGNVHFKRADRRTPRIATQGKPGARRRLSLTLKLMADVGLIGLPNAGKSTLLARLSNARPRIADYPFTTLEPNLGIVPLGDYGSLVMADLPGLIEGAAEGRGLGQRFLRHIERTRFLLLLVDASQPEPTQTYRLLRRELRGWSRELEARAHRVCYTKVDLLGGREPASLPQLGPAAPLEISAHTGEGIKVLLAALEQELQAGYNAPSGQEEPGEIAVDGQARSTAGATPAAAPARPWPTRWIVPQRPGARLSDDHQREET